MSAFLVWDNSNDYRTTSLRRVRGKNLNGKVCVVTGASGSMGKEMVFALYHAGATVVATGRSLTKLDAAKEEVLARPIPSSENFAKVDGGEIVNLAMDLGDYDSIAEFSATCKTKFGSSGSDGIHVLINNAGTIPNDTFQTNEKTNLETTFQNNFLSQVVLTETLLPLLEQGRKDARIVNVSSMSHGHGFKPTKWETIPSTSKETFGGYDKDYCESKWLLTAYSVALSRRLANQGSKVLVFSADPGISPQGEMWANRPAIMRFMVRYVFGFLTKSPRQASACAVRLAVEDSDLLSNGGYYQSGVEGGMREDCADPEEWKKAAALLETTLPATLQWVAKANAP